MEAGILGLLNAPTETIEQFNGHVTQDGIDYQYSVVPQQSLHHPSLNKSIQTGHAAMEVPKETEEINITDGEISQDTGITTNTKYTNWFLLPGDLLVVENSTGRFLYELIASELGWQVDRAELDLTTMTADYEETEVWQVGFYDHLGTAQKGVVYGDDVVDDQDIGDALADARVNQLGLDYPYQQDSIKVTLTESGYVELYQPSSYDTADFAAYLHDEIQQYISGVYDGS